MQQDFDWRLIRSFLAALEHGSLLGAARALGSSQPTMGRQLAELETQLGAVLFERTGRGLKPTPTALRLADAARAMECGALQLARDLTSAQASASGTVRLSASQPVACVLLPEVLARMRQDLPGIQIELVSSNAVSNLLRREADIAVRMLRPAQATLVARKLGDVEMGIFGHRDYLARRGTPQHPRDLLGHDLIGYDTDDAIVRGFAALGFSVRRENFQFRSDDLIAQWQAVRHGLGLGFASVYHARHEPEVLRVLPSLRVPPLPMWLAVHREIRSNGRIRAVYDYLAHSLPALIQPKDPT